MTTFLKNYLEEGNYLNLEHLVKIINNSGKKNEREVSQRV